jgi:hypothetical protein
MSIIGAARIRHVALLKRWFEGPSREREIVILEKRWVRIIRCQWPQTSDALFREDGSRSLKIHKRVSSGTRSMSGGAGMVNL